MKYETGFSAIGKAKGWALLAILFFWLIIPLIIWICYCAAVTYDRLVITDDKVVWHKGVINKSERSSVLTGILGVSVEQTMVGSIFNYGDVRLNTVGKHSDLVFEGVKNPQALASFLKKKIVKDSDVKQIITD